LLFSPERNVFVVGVFILGSVELGGNALLFVFLGFLVGVECRVHRWRILCLPFLDQLLELRQCFGKGGRRFNSLVLADGEQQPVVGGFHGV